MGLITKEVEVKINTANAKYLESKGYIIPKALNKEGKLMPKWGAVVIVKVEDLSDGGHSIVDIEYDCCHKLGDMEYKTYKKHNHNGKIYCKHCKSRILNSGENHPLYDKSKTDEERQNGRAYKEYTDFVKRVLARDNYTCQCCGKSKSNSLEVHHLEGYSWCVEKRTDDTNGITLCTSCHSNYHSKYGNFHTTKQNFEEWIGYAINNLDKYNGELPSARQIYDYESSKIYPSASYYSNLFDVNVGDVRRCCNHSIRKPKYVNVKGIEKSNKCIVRTVRGHHLFWLDEYENMTQEELLRFVKENNTYKKVVCIITGEIFDKMNLASKKYNLKTTTTISNCCRGKQKSTGKLPDGTPLQWMYYEDFLKLPQEEQNEILARNKGSSTDGSFLV